MHAMRCAYNHTMQTSPGAMVFNRDMMINIPMIADINAIALAFWNMHMQPKGAWSHETEVRPYLESW